MKSFLVDVAVSLLGRLCLAIEDQFNKPIAPKKPPAKTLDQQIDELLLEASRVKDTN